MHSELHSGVSMRAHHTGKLDTSIAAKCLFGFSRRKSLGFQAEAVRQTPTGNKRVERVARKAATRCHVSPRARLRFVVCPRSARCRLHEIRPEALVNHATALRRDDEKFSRCQSPHNHSAKKKTMARFASQRVANPRICRLNGESRACRALQIGAEVIYVAVSLLRLG